MRAVPDGRVQQHTVEEVVDGPVPQVVERIGMLLQTIPQERTSERTVGQIGCASAPDLGEDRRDGESGPTRTRPTTDSGANCGCVRSSNHGRNIGSFQRRIPERISVDAPVARVREEIVQAVKHVACREGC